MTSPAAGGPTPPEGGGPTPPEGDVPAGGGSTPPAVGGGAAGTRRVAAHGVVYVVGTALQGLGVLLVIPFITRTLSRADYGAVSTSLVAVQLVGAVAAAGVPQVILREHHRGSDGPRRARALAGAMLVLAAVVGLLGAGAVAGVGALGGASSRLPALVVLAAGALTAVVAGQALMRAQQRPGAFLAVAILSTVGAQLVGLLAARAEPSATTFVTAYALALVVAAVVGVALTRPVPPWREAAAVRAGLRVAAPLLPHAVAMLVLLMGDVLLVSATLGREAVASYQVALQLGNMPFVLVTALVNAWAPAVFAQPESTRWQWTRRTGTGLALLVAVGGAGVTLLSPWLVAVAAPAAYDHALLVRLVALIVLVAPAYLLYNGSSLALIDAERTGRLALVAVAAAAVLLVLGCLASRFGAEGVAAARVAGYVTLSLGCAALARRHGLRWPLAWVLAVVAVTVGFSLAGAALPSEGAGALVRVALAVLLGAGVVAGAWRLRGRLRPAEAAS